MFIGQDEEETKQWDRFWGSGSVEDYLRFKGCQEEKIREDRGYCGDGERKFPGERDRVT